MDPAPKVRLAEGVLDRLQDRARAGFPLEICGFLVGPRGRGRRDVSRLVAATNVAAEGRSERFTVDPRELLSLEEDLDDSPEEIVGLYHSHPNRSAEPSPLDRRNASLWPSMLHVIVPSELGRAGIPRFFWADEDGGALVLCSADSWSPADSSPSRGSRAAGSRPS